MPATATRKTATAAKKTARAAKSASPAEPMPATTVTKAAKPLKGAKVDTAAVKPLAKPRKEAAKPAPKEKAEKIKKPKMVRDSFTMPEPEYKVLGEVKRACLKAGVEVKKSELLRVGVALLRKLKLDELKAAVDALPPVKAGRPKATK